MLSFDLYKEIFRNLEFHNKIRFKQICKKLDTELEITDFCNIHYKYLKKLDNQIIANYNQIEKLNTHSNKINNIGHLTKLKVLYCNTLINNNDVKNLDLLKLNVNGEKNVTYVFNSSEITNINHMTKLKVLFCPNYSNLTNEGINKLNLTKLIVNHNTKIKDISHKNNLKFSIWSYVKYYLYLYYYLHTVLLLNINF